LEGDSANPSACRHVFEESIAVHGHSGFCRRPDAMHPGKRENAEKKVLALSRKALNRFHGARE